MTTEKNLIKIKVIQNEETDQIAIFYNSAYKELDCGVPLALMKIKYHCLRCL
jgi:hypothetical protein